MFDFKVKDVHSNSKRGQVPTGVQIEFFLLFNKPNQATFQHLVKQKGRIRIVTSKASSIAIQNYGPITDDMFVDNSTARAEFLDRIVAINEGRETTQQPVEEETKQAETTAKPETVADEDILNPLELPPPVKKIKTEDTRGEADKRNRSKQENREKQGTNTDSPEYKKLKEEVQQKDTRGEADKRNRSKQENREKQGLSTESPEYKKPPEIDVDAIEEEERKQYLNELQVEIDNNILPDVDANNIVSEKDIDVNTGIDIKKEDINVHELAHKNAITGNVDYIDNQGDYVFQTKTEIDTSMDTSAYIPFNARNPRPPVTPEGDATTPLDVNPDTTPPDVVTGQELPKPKDFIHKMALYVYFGSSVEWDKELVLGRVDLYKSMGSAKAVQYAYDENKRIFNKYGVELLLDKLYFTSGQGVIQENIEILQLFFSYLRNASKGTRTQRVAMPLSSFQGLTQMVGGNEGQKWKSQNPPNTALQKKAAISDVPRTRFNNGKPIYSNIGDYIRVGYDETEPFVLRELQYKPNTMRDLFSVHSDCFEFED